MIFQQEKDLFFNANYERRLGADLEKCRFIFVFFFTVRHYQQRNLQLNKNDTVYCLTLMPAVSLDKSIDF